MTAELPLLLDTCAAIWISEDQPLASEALSCDRAQSSSRRVHLRFTDHRMGGRVTGVTRQADLAHVSTAMVRTPSGRTGSATGRHVTRGSHRFVVSSWNVASRSCGSDPGRNRPRTPLSPDDAGHTTSHIRPPRPSSGARLLTTGRRPNLGSALLTLLQGRHGVPS